MSKQYGKLDLRCMDCMDLMKEYPDNHFDLAIVDPPYGIGESVKKRENTVSDKWKSPTKKIHNPKEWDSKPPSQDYFDEVFRVSKSQIIWGGNYLIDKIKRPSMGWIFWDKKNGDSDFSDGELAYTSFKKGLRKFEWLWNGFQKQNKEHRIHPTQKPVALYKWLLENYGKSECKKCRGCGKAMGSCGDAVPCERCNETGIYHAKILDTHLGSGSIAIACYYMGFDLTGSELDPDYFKAMQERIDKETRQMELF